jgi:hypothetical protein
LTRERDIIDGDGEGAEDRQEAGRIGRRYPAPTLADNQGVGHFQGPEGRDVGLQLGHFVEDGGGVIVVIVLEAPDHRDRSVQNKGIGGDCSNKVDESGPDSGSLASDSRGLAKLPNKHLDRRSQGMGPQSLADLESKAQRGNRFLSPGWGGGP